jgi:hypothetical protein
MNFQLSKAGVLEMNRRLAIKRQMCFGVEN